MMWQKLKTGSEVLRNLHQLFHLARRLHASRLRLFVLMQMTQHPALVTHSDDRALASYADCVVRNLNLLHCHSSWWLIIRLFYILLSDASNLPDLFFRKQCEAIQIPIINPFRCIAMAKLKACRMWLKSKIYWFSTLLRERRR